MITFSPNLDSEKRQPLLTVIVPCYNVQDYLDRCLASIITQIYNNLEIILIEDGSTDQTGMLCDVWQAKDSRIRVIHKQNGGLDFARKTGIENATAEYIAFVDADDWIDENMCAKMMSAMIDTNSDIARCEFCFVYPDGEIVQRNIAHKTDNFEIIGREEGVLLILEDKKWKSHLVQNIYKRQLFDYYVHQKGRLFEDLAGTHILFHHAAQTVYLHDVFYYYFQRSGSLINPQNIQGKIIKEYHYRNAIYERYLFVKQHPEYHSMLQTFKKSAFTYGILSLWDMIDYPQYFPENAYEEQVARLKTFSFPLRVSKRFVLNLDLVILKLFPRCYQSYYRFIYQSFGGVFKRFLFGNYYKYLTE